MAIICKINEKDNVVVATEKIAQDDMITADGKVLQVRTMYLEDIK